MRCVLYPRMWNIWFTLLAIIPCLLAGCEGIDPITRATSTPHAPGEVLFEDDFSDVPSGWGTWNREGGLIAYEQGSLRILVNDVNYDYWSVAGKKFRDLGVGGDVTRKAGAGGNDFGLICRYQDKHNFYMFLVSSDGYYGIAKLKEDQHSLIGTKQLQYSENIKPDKTGHHLQASCVGDSLRLSVDGQALLEVHDSDFSHGDVGVLAGAYTKTGVDILFDNFKVKQP
jgi:hypothetical protein